MLNILVLTHNDSCMITRFVDEIYKNTSCDFSVCILDNNSTDGTVDILKNMDKKNLFVEFNSINTGVAVGRNYLYTMATSLFHDIKYVCFIDSDQFVKRDWDKKYIELMNSGYDIVGIEAWQMRSNYQPYKKNIDKKEKYNYVGGGGMCIKKDTIGQIGLFDPQFSPVYFEDTDFCFSAFFNGFKIGWCVDQVIEHKKKDLLLKGKRREMFFTNLVRFQKKWGNHFLPQYQME